jgi:hypothetical protein
LYFYALGGKGKLNSKLGNTISTLYFFGSTYFVTERFITPNYFYMTHDFRYLLMSQNNKLYCDFVKEFFKNNLAKENATENEVQYLKYILNKPRNIYEWLNVNEVGSSLN